MTPTSAVVPPISITMASLTSQRNVAPLMLLVGPDAIVNTGKFSALLALKANKHHEFSKSSNNSNTIRKIVILIIIYNNSIKK